MLAIAIFLALYSAWHPIAQCKQNYNLIKQACSYSDDSYLDCQKQGQENRDHFKAADNLFFFYFSSVGWKKIIIKISLHGIQKGHREVSSRPQGLQML